MMRPTGLADEGDALSWQRIALISQIIGAACEGIDHPNGGAHRFRQQWGGDREILVVGVGHQLFSVDSFSNFKLGIFLRYNY